MQYEAARVLLGADGRESAEFPQCFETYQQALKYIDTTPVSKDGVRPWIRDTHVRDGQFMVIGGKHYWMPIDAAPTGNGHAFHQ